MEFGRTFPQFNNQNIKIEKSINANSPAGNYLVEIDEKSFFIVIHKNLPDFGLIIDFNKSLYKNDVSVIEILNSFNEYIIDGEKYSVEIRFFYDYRFYDKSISDFKKLALLMKRFHQKSKTFRNSIEIFKISKKYTELLTEFQSFVLSSKSNWIKDIFNKIEFSADLIEKFEEELFVNFDAKFIYTEDNQAIHGDLHKENILFIENDPYMIDFEKSFRVYSSPLYDIAYLFQRFALFENTYSYIGQYYSVFKDNYGKTFKLPELYSFMQLIQKRLMLITLYNQYRNPSGNNIIEFKKFLNIFIKNEANKRCFH